MSDVRTILESFGERADSSTVWKVQSATVILHKALERIAAKAGISYAAPTILRAERDEAVILVTGTMGERTEWSIGEAVITNGSTPGNYKVSGKQAAYPYAMAEKRAKDRVILKLIGLHGLAYSEEEADEFKGGERRPADDETDRVGNVVSLAVTDLCRNIDAAKTINGVTDVMLDPELQRRLAEMSDAEAKSVRDHAKTRLVALGWKPARDRGGAA